MSSVIGPVMHPALTATTRVHSAPNPTRVRNWLQRWRGAFVCASLGIVPTVRDADYIGSWLEVLREDNRAVVRSASAGSKAADFLLGFLTQATDSGAAGNEEAA